MRRLNNIRLPRRPNGTGAEPSEHWSALLDDAGRLQALTPMRAEASMAGENWQGDWLSPMGVDLQINGGLGLAFPELQDHDLPRLLELLDLLWEDGVDAISPTLVTCGIAPLRQALAVLRAARDWITCDRICAAHRVLIARAHRLLPRERRKSTKTIRP